MITLSTDFGSPYPAAMRGVICSQTDARIEDIAHDFPRQDVRAAAFWLTQTVLYFPPAVHCVVVDPGVGTDRDALVVRAGDHALVGPDNGVLLPVARELASGNDGVEVFTWAYDDPASSTFHGRDVFAPAAASVHDQGIDRLDALSRATPASEYVDLCFPAPDIESDHATGEILVVDDFGNAVTNIPGDAVSDAVGDSVTVNGRSAPVRRAYADLDPGARLVTVGSHGNVELAVNRGRGDDAFDVEPGSAVELGFRGAENR